MTLIDADKFLVFLIYSKHIDSLTCKEVKEAIEMCKVDVLEQITAEIYEHFMTIDGGVHDVSAIKCMEIIDKYREEQTDAT